MMNHRISVLFDLTSGICLSRAFQSGEYVLSTMGMSRIMPVRTSGIACERFMANTAFPVASRAIPIHATTARINNGTMVTPYSRSGRPPDHWMFF